MPIRSHQTIHQLYEEQVFSTPHQSAVISGDTVLTFEELNQKANQVAHYIRSLGGSKGATIGLSMNSTHQAIICILGILKSECIYVPIHPERLESITHQIQPLLVFTDIFYEANKQQIEAMPKSNLTKSMKDQETAYLIHTSGSTGFPKGVMGHHSGLINRFQWMWERWPFQEKEKACQKTSFYFVDSFWEIFGPLLKGISLTIIPYAIVRDIDANISFLKNNDISRIVLVPSLLKAMLESKHFSDLDQLYLWTVSGETLPVDLVRHFKDRLPQAKLLNIYGSSEVAADVTCYEAHLWDGSTKTIPIGKSISNTSIHLLDDALQQVQNGEIGEIYVEGAGVALGYYQQSELTAQFFMNFGGKRCYKTGDFGKRLSDGNIEYLGRRDRQIKINGERIECGEIEHVISSHPFVQECVVIPSDKNRLIAYIVCNRTIEKEVLYDYLSQKIPLKMHPHEIYFLDKIPLNHSGKIDLMALKNHEPIQMLASNTPLNLIEHTIATIWCELLNVSKLEYEDHFFYLGGDSLTATRMISRLDSELGIDIPFHLIFECPKFLDFSRKVARFSPSEKPSLVKGIYSNLIPVSYAQQRSLWIETLIKKQNIVISAFSLQEEIDIDSLRSALDCVIQRHEILRTSFKMEGASLFQYIEAHIEWELEIIDLEVNERALQATYIDIGKAPLFRFKLYKPRKNEYVFVILMHHLIVDGWSQTIFNKELNEFYRSKNRPQLKPFQYADFTLWQIESLPKWKNQLEFWKIELDQMIPKTYLAADLPLQDVPTYSVDTFVFSLTSEELIQLKEIGESLQTSLFVTMLSFFQIMLHRHSGEEDIVVGTPTSNRYRAGCETILGPLVNVIFLRNSCLDNLTVSEFIKRVKESTLRAFDNQDYPFHQLVREIPQLRDCDYLSLFQILFMFNAESVPLALEGMDCKPSDIKPGYSHYDLAIVVDESESGLDICLLYSLDKFHRTTMEALAQEYRRLLLSVMRDRNQLISEL